MSKPSDFIQGLFTGFIFGAIACYFALVIIANTWATKTNLHHYEKFGDVTCLQIKGDFVSCNWDEWIESE